jgi:hypothetical protein
VWTKYTPEETKEMVAAMNIGSILTANYCYPAGFDGGNTDSCFSAVEASGYESLVTLPSAIVEASGERLELFRSAVHGGENTNTDSYKQDVQVEYLGINYYVGYLALRQSKRSSTQKGDETRYYSLEQLIRLLATSGLAIKDQSYEISLVTTVPVGYFTKELRRRVKDTFEGTFKFLLNGVQRQVTIAIRKVMVEGPPALVLYGAQSAGQRRLIIDGGGHTTDLTLLDGNDPIPDQCKGVDLGVENIGDYVYETIREQHGRRLSLQERSDILRAYASRTTLPTITCGTYELSHDTLHGIVFAGCQKVANATLIEARSLWSVVNDVVAGDVKWQYHIGGSALFYNDLLRAKMSLLRPVEGASAANARGSARIAKALG